jgi:hypothetical protein
VGTRKKELLAVPYFHVVFKLPDHLNAIALAHPKELYKILFDSVWQTISCFGNNPKELGAKMVMIAVFDTLGQNLSVHPHLHYIVPKGRVNKAGYWKKGKRKADFLFSVQALSIKFRGVFVTKLRKQLPEIPKSLYYKLFSNNWVVCAKDPFGKPEHMIEYLGRYAHKIAINNYRISANDTQNKTVTFSMKEYRNQGKKTTQTLSTKDFIKRFQNHILPKAFKKIRH